MKLFGSEKRRSAADSVSGSTSPAKKSRAAFVESAGLLEAADSEARVRQASLFNCGHDFFRGIFGLISGQPNGHVIISAAPPLAEEREENEEDNANWEAKGDAEEEWYASDEEEEEEWGSEWDEEDDNDDADSDGCGEDHDDNDDVAFEVELEDGWQPFDAETGRRIADAEENGQSTIEYKARGQSYIVDLRCRRQTNTRTGVQRPIRRSEPQDASPQPQERTGNGDDGGEAVYNLQRLRDLLREPPPAPPQLADGSAARLNGQQIRAAIERFVPEAVTWIAPRSGGTPALDFLVQSYDHGLPAFPPAVSRHLAEGVRVIMGAISDPEGSGVARSRAKCLAQQLAEAFTNCQAVQARTIDSLQAEVRGLASHSLPAQLRSLVEEHRELALDRVVGHFHPRASTASDSDPTRQLPHLANRYRRHLGRHAGFAGGPRAEAAAADRNARGPLPVSRQRALRQFWREFSIRELVRAVVADVNQTDPEANRRLDRKLIMAWAGSDPSVGHRIFYDEAAPELYPSLAPSREQRSLLQPALHEALAAELLLSALGGRGSAAAAAAVPLER